MPRVVAGVRLVWVGLVDAVELLLLLLLGNGDAGLVELESVGGEGTAVGAEAASGYDVVV
jgi:hypothetical protein